MAHVFATDVEAKIPVCLERDCSWLRQSVLQLVGNEVGSVICRLENVFPDC